MAQSFAGELGRIPMSRSLTQSLERAHRLAREQSHRAVTLEHLLFALTEDTEAAGVLQVSNVDLAQLRTDVSGYLGNLLDDMRAEGSTDPQPSAELLRVLRAAASAAQQSRRRQIDGAIVLAALVGDGKSPAAGLLKAHGLTFDDAIRALQRPSAPINPDPQANLATNPPNGNQANAKASPAPSPGPPPARPIVERGPLSPVNPPPPGSVAARAGPERAVPPLSKTEEILASVRARVQADKASTQVADAVAAAPENRPPQATAPLARGNAAQNQEPLQTPRLAGGVAQSAATVQPHGAVSPPLSAERPPPPPLTRAPLPFPVRPVQPGQGPLRPPLPERQAPVAARDGDLVAPPLPSWSETVSRATSPTATPVPPDSRLAGGPIPRPAGFQPKAQRPRSAAGFAAQFQTGQLVENIPRSMRSGVPHSIEVRIARDKIEGLGSALKGRGMPQRHDLFITRAMSVRLRAPDGGFWIEPGSPETQWIENMHGLMQDDYASWRWTVTPQHRGKARLQLIVSARTVAHDGLAAETAWPDQVIEVRVRTNYVHTAMRWGGWALAAIAGGVLGRLAESALNAAHWLVGG
jgi:neural Wiskott-Aldrich syndrome protein